MNKPKNGNELIKWSNDNMPALLERSSPVLEKPATERMIKKNMRYIAKHPGLEKIWKSTEGQESILHAYGESLEHAATMPEMGSIVPFGNYAEFVPSIECYLFLLGNGKNAPFEDINIVLIHENDKTNITQSDGVFNVEMQMGFPRGEIIAVAVYATRKDTGKRIGEVYDVERLMQKAFVHSAGYKKYILDKEDWSRMKAEGKLKKDHAGRYYMEKKGKYGDYKVYEHDIVNPYDGPDRPEMLKKAAGKSFFRPFMRTRNAMAMAEEWKEEDEKDVETVADNILQKASEQFENVVDAEVVETKEETNKDEEISDI